MFSFIGWLIIGGLAGWIASIIMKTNSQQGLFMDIGIGIVGSFIGGFVFSLLGLTAGGFIGSLITATVGAVIFIAAWKRFGR